MSAKLEKDRSFFKDISVYLVLLLTVCVTCLQYSEAIENDGLTIRTISGEQQTEGSEDNDNDNETLRLPIDVDITRAYSLPIISPLPLILSHISLVDLYLFSFLSELIKPPISR